MIITMTGKPCSGKSTIAKLFCEKYGFESLDAGKLFKLEAKRRGMNITEFTALRLTDPSFDEEFDKRYAVIGKERINDDLFIESRVAWHFIPQSFKVFADIEEDVMVERLVGAEREGKERYDDPVEARKALISRMNTDRQVYKNTYNIDYLDLKNYDLVLDTSSKTPEQLVEILYEGYVRFCKKRKK